MAGSRGGRDAGAEHLGRGRMFVFAFAVPGFLVVVLGYVVGYALAGLMGSPSADASEMTGWTTGLLMLLVVVRLALRAWRRRGGRGGHQK